MLRSAVLAALGLGLVACSTGSATTTPDIAGKSFQIRAVLDDASPQAPATSKVAPGPVSGEDEGNERLMQTNCELPPKPASAAQTIVACDAGDPQAIYVLGPALFTESDVASASVTAPQGGVGGYSVNVTLTDAAAGRFADVTDEATQKEPPTNQLALMLDQRVVSAPSVQARIPGGQVQITGGFTQDEAAAVAAQIQP